MAVTHAQYLIYKGTSLMRDERWFNDDVRKEIYQKYDNYYSLFEALLYPDGHGILSYKLKDRSFSAQELELILILRQAFTMHKKEGEYLLSGFNQLAEWFKRIEQSITDCDYLFIQAYISFICEQIKNNFHDKDLDSITRENLIGLAQFSVDMAEFYANRSTGYQDVELSSDRQFDYIEERNRNLYELLYSLGSLSSKTKDNLIDEIVNTIKKEYLQQPSLNDDGFANLYEYLGYIDYHGSNHLLHQMAFDELDNDIHCEVYHLTLPDLVMLLEDDIHSIVDDGDMEDLRDWHIFEKIIKESHEFDNLLREIRREFMRGVPEYFPE